MLNKLVVLEESEKIQDPTTNKPTINTLKPITLDNVTGLSVSEAPVTVPSIVPISAG